MSEKHKAYYVSDSSEEEGAIVYAKTNGDAKRRGANLFDDEWLSVAGRRAPQWDDHYPHGPTDDEKWESGWHFECCICSCLAGKGYGLRFDGEAYCEDHMDVYAWRFRGTSRASPAGNATRPGVARVTHGSQLGRTAHDHH